MTITQDELNKAVEETQQKSFVMIDFVGLGISEFKIYKQNVNPAQILGALVILELQVKNWYIQEENKRVELEKEQQLSVPQNKILTTR
jgi:hypothetical protein